MSAVANFAFPTATLYGAGTLTELPTRLHQMGCRRPLVITDPGLLATRAFEALKNALGSHKLGQDWEIFHGVHSNPIEEDVVQAAKAFRAGECDAIVGFGGGSALDVSKASRLLIKKPDLKLERFNLRDDWTGLPRCVCLPTTAGSGSEMSRTADITLSGSQRRATLFLPRLLPKLVILDPQLTEGLPRELTAATAVDALTHCIEAFTSPVFHPLCDGIALEGIHMIVQGLPKAMQNPHDVAARGQLLVAASMGGVAMQKELGTTHALAHPLSGLCGMHHGAANAVCLPHVMNFNSQRKPGLYQRVGLACGLDLCRENPAEADRKTIEYFRQLIAGLGLSTRLSDYHVKEGVIETLATQAFADPCNSTNPVTTSWADLKSLYHQAL